MSRVRLGMMPTIDPKIINITKAFKKSLDNAGIKYEGMYLFGSHSQKRANANSDIDVCVVSDHMSDDPLRNYVELRTISRKISIDIEPHVISTHDFDDKYYALAAQVKEHGIPIHS